MALAESHPELAEEQAHIDHAYRQLEQARADALKLKDMVEVGKGGTNQARWEREVFYESIATRLRDLNLGERSLCFGRIDQDEEAGGGSYHIGRIAISSKNQDPLVVDWRAPIAEAFYRATGAVSLGLVRRRHFVSRNRELLDMEDEFFGEAATSARVVINGVELRGAGALISALETNRSGRLGDIIGTIQGEQDEIIRSTLGGVLVVQGGPGTGKTVVALHRAAYLLYTYRFPLEGQGLLVIGPNRLFLRYIEQVLPSLGEAGVEISVLADLIPSVSISGRDNQAGSRIKGDLRMVKVVRRALADRQRPLRDDLVVPMGIRRIRVPAEATKNIVQQARRRFRTHNAGRKYVESSLLQLLSEYHPDEVEPQVIKEQVGDSVEVREALFWMWPVLTPAQLLHDLYGSQALIDSAAAKLSSSEREALRRTWTDNMDAGSVTWTVDDVPVLDEALEVLGALPGKQNGELVRTYGHIVVDEAQDLSPMQLRMLTRRSLNGSMTVVGDIAQSTGAWAHDDWDEVLNHLPDRKPPRRAELTVGYRIPGPAMELAAKILKHAAPELAPPESVRQDGDLPEFHAGTPETLIERTVSLVVEEMAREVGNVAVVCPQSMSQQLADGFEAAEVSVGLAPADGLDHQVTVVPVNFVKGLEVDVSVVVEPALILSEEPQGARSLYVASTRATKRLLMVHSGELPAMLADAGS